MNEIEIKERVPISIRLRLLDSSETNDEIFATINSPISAGTESDIVIGEEIKKMRIQRIIIDPQNQPSTIVLARYASTKVSFPILSSIRKFFGFLRFLSIGHWIREWGMKKGRRIAVSIVDWYIIFWIILEIIMLGLIAWTNLSNIIILIFAIFAGYRIFELIQVYFNILLFDQLYHFEAGEEYFLYSSARSILISIISYIELIICYGLVFYSNVPNGFSTNAPISDILGALYFSTCTIATVGFGDIVPINMIRLLAMSEAFFGVLFTVTIISRFLNFLPIPKSNNWWR